MGSSKVYLVSKILLLTPTYFSMDQYSRAPHTVLNKQEYVLSESLFRVRTMWVPLYILHMAVMVDLGFLWNKLFSAWCTGQWSTSKSL